ncbi:MAG: pyruvate kinase, partial [Parasporobacterium sp.]|nr:pyruvate kinase [Parasporobacterium sp.]
MRKTKIVCTLGPASSTEEVMEQMFKAGMNIGRLNFSHGTHESHGEMIDRFRAVRDRLGISAAVLLDTKGPEIRLEQVEEGTELKDNSEFILSTETVTGNSKKASVTYKNMPSVLKAGDTVLIDD